MTKDHIIISSIQHQIKFKYILKKKAVWLGKKKFFLSYYKKIKLNLTSQNLK